MELFPKVKHKLEKLLYDQELRDEHKVKYHCVKATSSFLALGILPPEYQESLANNLDLPKNTFTMFGSVYGALFGAFSYGGMYFGMVKTSDSVKMVAQFLDQVPLDSVVAVYGSLFVASHIARAVVSASTKKAQYPYSPVGVVTSLGILGAGKGLEKVVNSIKN